MFLSDALIHTHSRTPTYSLSFSQTPPAHTRTHPHTLSIFFRHPDSHVRTHTIFTSRHHRLSQVSLPLYFTHSRTLIMCINILMSMRACKLSSAQARMLTHLLKRTHIHFLSSARRTSMLTSTSQAASTTS